MKKILLSLSIVAALFAGDRILSKQELDSVLKSSILYPKLKEDMKKGVIKVSGVETDSLYVIIIKTPRKSGNIYITKDKKYTIIGNVINNKTGSMLSPRTHKVNKKTVQEGITFSFGKGKEDLYVVTDPECPFCRMMEKSAGESLGEKYRVHVILFPLSFHKNAKAMSYYILAGKNDQEKAKRFKEVLNGSNAWKNYHPTKAEKEKFDKILKNAKKAVNELQAKGTPSIYDSKFNPINWQLLATQKGDKK